MRELFISIKKVYLDQIIKGTKIEEYRMIKPYWENKLINQKYDCIKFKSGYFVGSPEIKIQYLGYEIKKYKSPLFGDKEVMVFALKLGKIL